MMYFNGWGTMGWFGVLMMALIWAGVIGLVIWGVRSLSSSPRRDDRDGALIILRQRYASGEISDAEFEHARQTLETTATRAAEPVHR